MTALTSCDNMVASAAPRTPSLSLSLIHISTAVALALSVVEPHHSGIGGGCFSLLYSAGEKKCYAIDGRGVAPMQATEHLFMRDGKVQSEWKDLGGQSVAVPDVYKRQVFCHRHEPYRAVA